MPGWLRALLDLLKGFIPAFIKTYMAELKKRGVLVDKGAADQRQADENADTELANEAKVRKDEIHDLDDDALADRARKWMRPPR